MHVGVDADARLLAPEGEGTRFRAVLRPTPPSEREPGEGVGDAPFVLIDEGAADRVEGAALHAVEAGGVDDLRDAPGGEPRERTAVGASARMRGVTRSAHLVARVRREMIVETRTAQGPCRLAALVTASLSRPSDEGR